MLECWNDEILIIPPRGIDFHRCLIILGHQIFIITYDFLNQRLMISLIKAQKMIITKRQPVSVGEMLIEEFMEPPAVTQGQLAKANSPG
jgi:hypothetical protein